MSCCSFVNHTYRWHVAAPALAVICLLGARTYAGSISNNASAPAGNILASQLADPDNGGTQDGGRNYLDNGGPPGQTFTVTSAGLATRFSFKGRGDSSDSWNGGVNPWEGNEIWALQVAQVNAGDGSLTVLASETATGFTAGGATGITDYITFTLAAGVALSPGNTYAFSMYVSDAGGPGTDGGWFGLAHTDSDVYPGGTAINTNNSIANPGGNGGAPQRAFPAAGFAAPAGAYDYVFAVQSVPEPVTGLMAFSALAGLLTVRRRR